MKKLSLIALLVLAAFALVGCQTTTTTAEKEFKVDGEFTAFETSVHSNNAQQVTMVTVIIENGEIKGYKIDARQATRTVDNKGTVEDTSDDTYAFAWNASTKAELGFNYKMHYRTYTATLTDPATGTLEGYQTWLTANSKNEWHTQAALIEAYWLANGVDAMENDAEKVITNVAGVTVKNSGYSDLAKEAIALAKAGKFQAIKCTGTDLYIATMTVAADGTKSELKLDVLQLNSQRTDKSKFEWNTETKQEKGFNYKMHYRTYTATLTDPATGTLEGYQTWLTANSKLEWFQQANIITDYVMANGWNAAYKANASGIGMTTDGTNALAGTAGVSIKSQSYFDVLSYLFAKVK